MKKIAQYSTKEERMRELEEEFYRKVNQVISEKITPTYNFFTILFAVIFAYFVA